jgi:Protein of unknown function (DUF2877)
VTVGDATHVEDRTLTARTVGAGARSLRAQPSVRRVVGSIVGSFSRGWYVRSGSDLIAIGTIPSGPLHVTTEVAFTETPIVAGMSVTVGPGGVGFGSVLIDLADAADWSPRLPTEHEIDRLARSMESVDIDDLIGEDLTDVWPEVRIKDPRRVGDQAFELQRIVNRLEGRGIGLTPTGDDVIAGMLLVDAWRRPGTDAETHRLRLASGARTSDLSRAFLKWAALGQSIEPVHQLVGAATADAGATFPSAVAAVAGIGASSGRGLLAGMAIGLAAASPLQAGEASVLLEAGPEFARQPSDQASRRGARKIGRGHLGDEE